MKKSIYSVCSSYDGNDLAALDAQIIKALATYQQAVDDYNWGMNYGHVSYAKKERLPLVNSTKAVLDTLNAQKKAMLSDIGQTQGIDIVNTSVATATKDVQTVTPWRTIGLAVGALIIIVIIVKLV